MGPARKAIPLSCFKGCSHGASRCVSRRMHLAIQVSISGAPTSACRPLSHQLVARCSSPAALHGACQSRRMWLAGSRRHPHRRDHQRHLQSSSVFSGHICVLSTRCGRTRHYASLRARVGATMSKESCCCIALGRMLHTWRCEVLLSRMHRWGSWLPGRSLWSQLKREMHFTAQRMQRLESQPSAVRPPVAVSK